jgi:hypothetical protein
VWGRVGEAERGTGDEQGRVIADRGGHGKVLMSATQQ